MIQLNLLDAIWCIELPSVIVLLTNLDLLVHMLSWVNFFHNNFFIDLMLLILFWANINVSMEGESILGKGSTD